MWLAAQTVRRLHRYIPSRSPDDGDEEYSDLGDSPSRGASEDITDSPVSSATVHPSPQSLMVDICSRRYIY